MLELHSNSHILMKKGFNFHHYHFQIIQTDLNCIYIDLLSRYEIVIFFIISN